MNSNYAHYINERYSQADFPISMDEIIDRFEEIYQTSSISVLNKPYGFMTYELKGDAVIIHDVFVNKENRATGKGWDMHNELCSLAKKLNKRVMIGLRDKTGKNQYLGLEALKAAGFVKAQDLDDREIFVKGI